MSHYRKLKKHIIDVVREDQIKLGYRSETIRLYYPLESLNRLLGRELDIPEMYSELADFSEEYEEELGKIQITSKGERFCLTFPPKTAEYVHEKLPRDAFLEDFIHTIVEPGAGLPEILDVFRRYSDKVHVEKLTHEEFDYLIYFTDGKPNDYRYCIALEELHMTYHRFTPEDYKELGFPAGTVLQDGTAPQDEAAQRSETAPQDEAAQRSETATQGGIRAIFIDIDNTLLSFDKYVKQTMKEGFAKFGLKPYEPYMYDVFTQENNSLWQEIEAGTLTFAELEKVRWNRIFASLEIDFDGITFEKYFRAKLYDSAIPEPGALDLLKRLSRNYILCVASNGPYLQQCHRLEVGGMKEFFSYFFISEKAGASKPSKDFFDYAFAKLNRDREKPILPAETIIIGDSLSSDIGGGRAYGMKTCFYRKNRDLPVPADVMVVEHLEEIDLSCME